MAELKEILMQDCVKAALEYIETGHVQRLRTNFNKLCKAWHADEFDPDELSLDVADIAKHIKDEPKIKDIAAMPAAKRNSLQIEWVVEEFIHKYWLIEKEEITTKMVDDVLLVADPLSRRHIVAQRVVIECIHALHTQQELHRLDEIMDDLATNPKFNE